MNNPILTALVSTRPTLIDQVFSRQGLTLTRQDVLAATWQEIPCPASHTRSEDSSCLFEQRFYKTTINGTCFVARVNRLCSAGEKDMLTWVGEYSEAVALMELALPDFGTILAHTPETHLVQQLCLTDLPFTAHDIRQATWKTISRLPERGVWRRMDIVSWYFFATQLKNITCIAGAIRTSLFTDSYQLWFGYEQTRCPLLGRSLIQNFC